MLPTFSQNVTPQEAFENVAQMDEERLKRTEFDGAFCKKFKLLVDKFSSFFAKRRKSVEKMIKMKWVCCVNNSKFYQRFHKP